jgi:hypothetical protein
MRFFSASFVSLMYKSLHICMISKINTLLKNQFRFPYRIPWITNIRCTFWLMKLDGHILKRSSRSCTVRITVVPKSQFGSCLDY